MKAYILRLILGISLPGVVDADFPSEFRNDRAQSGNYVMHLCGSGQPNSQAAKLQALLPYMRRTLGDVQIDIKAGTASRHGFRSFFKTNSNQPYVRSVFEAIADGRNVQRHSGRGTDTVTNPTFICANPSPEGSASTKWFTDNCINNPATHTTAAVYEPGTNLVVLCPRFWTFPTVLTADECPELIGPRRRRRFFPNDDGFMRSQFAALVHELVHLYSPFEEDGFGERYRIQDLVELDAEDSLKNAGNFAAYAAAVGAGCERFPVAPTVRGEDLRL